MPDPGAARALARLEKQIHKLWLLGRNIILGWSRDGATLTLAFVRNAALARVAADGRELLFSRVRRLDAPAFAALVARLGLETASLELPGALAAEPADDAIEQIVARHAVAYEAARPVAQVDIVGFSLLDPVEQLVQLNSLAFSLTMAQRRCRQLGLALDLGQSTTGDGFYLWDRSGHAGADVELFVALMMALSDNVIAARQEQQAAHGPSTPRLRSAFAVGGYFRFLQAAAGERTREYIVGATTIALARLIEGALPGQILLGTPPEAPARAAEDDAVAGFVARIRTALEGLGGLRLNGVGLRAVSIYPTGRPDGSGAFAIDRYRVRDKHGLLHQAYNIKANLYPEGAAAPLYLGVMHRALGRAARPAPRAAREARRSA